MTFTYLRECLAGAALALALLHTSEARADETQTQLFFKYDDSAAANCKSGGALYSTVYRKGWQPAVKVASDPIDSSPAAIYNPTTQRHTVFARDRNGSLVATFFQAGAWTPTAAIIDAKIASAPSVVYTAAHGETVFTFNGQRQLTATWYDATQNRWIPPQVLVAAPAIGNPSAVVTKAGRLMVFARSPGSHLVATWYDPGTGGWVDWTVFPKDTRINSNPVAVVSKEGRLHVFARDLSNRVAVTYFDGSWQPFTTIDSTMTTGTDPGVAELSWSDLSATVDALGRLTVFYLHYDKAAGAQPVGLWYDAAATSWKRALLPVTGGVVCSAFAPLSAPAIAE